MYIDVVDISYVISDDSITFLFTRDGKRHLYSKTIEELSQELDPDHFFRINRSQIIQASAIKEIYPFLNQRLKVGLKGVSDQVEFIVSRQKAKSFKEWMDH